MPQNLLINFTKIVAIGPQRNAKIQKKFLNQLSSNLKILLPIWTTKAMMKNKTMPKTATKTQTKCLKYPAYAIFLKSWWLTHSKYDDRYLTMVILFTPVTLVTLVTLFQSYIPFSRAECITVSGFLQGEWHTANVWRNFQRMAPVELYSQYTGKGRFEC